MIKDAEYYFNQPYKVEIVKNADKTFFASIKELPGCMTEGDTIEEVYEMVEDAKMAWISVALEDGRKIPMPEETEQKNYSGKLVLRLPKILHKRLALSAEENETSLNSYINMLLTDEQSSIEAYKETLMIMSQKLYEKDQKEWKMQVKKEIKPIQTKIVPFKVNRFDTEGALEC